MSYYDVDAILTDAQKLPCTFEIDVPGLGYLDGNPGGTVSTLSIFENEANLIQLLQIKAGTKLDLPLWLGVMLAVSSGWVLRNAPSGSFSTALINDSSNPGSQPLVTLDFPAPLQQQVTNALKADPKSVDLRAQAPHFYPLGARIMDLFEDDDLVDVLTEVSSSGRVGRMVLLEQSTDSR